MSFTYAQTFAILKCYKCRATWVLNIFFAVPIRLFFFSSPLHLYLISRIDSFRVPQVKNLIWFYFPSYSVP